MLQFGQSIRHVLAIGEQVIGCNRCGEVQHLVDGQEHVCNTDNPLAVTISYNQLPGKLAIPVE